jgi:hypothetical protein
MSDKTLEQLVVELTQATEALTEASKNEDIARQETTSARNKVNAAQKALDARMDTLRRKAPWNTDWSNKDRHPVTVEG